MGSTPNHAPIYSLSRLGHNSNLNNYGSYNNPAVDSLLDQAAVASDRATRFALYQEAEQLIIEDAACLPLWFGKNYVLVKPYVKWVPFQFSW